MKNKGKDATHHQLRWSYTPILPCKYEVRLRVQGVEDVKVVYMNSNKTKGAAADAALKDNPGAVCVSVKYVRGT